MSPEVNPPELVPEARVARRLGILGGSFDPPHGGHLHMARVARAARDLDHVLFVPAARPPHKPDRRLASGAERVHMLELLLADQSHVSIWTNELERAGPSYTIDTVEALREELGPRPIFFLILGSDNLAGLPRWHRVEDLLALVEPIVIPRRGAPVDPPELDGLAPALRERVRAGV
ncbi:MAG TPA: nicotinate (nicotinamide) nucleotide adenylyltransferase, partial [Planctomycetes bacterium]|nr:nicotinate (nicotinamide) nucleotide adenylyltransferase [Planctomycetota bacterium]